MRITGLDIVRVGVNQRGDWLHVLLRTDEGLSGLGEASHGGAGPDRDAIVIAILERQCRPLLMGRDPCAVALTTAALRPIGDSLAAATAVSACEQALWDLAGQAAGVPIHRLLGGPTRARIPLYANINRATAERTPEGFVRNAVAAAGEGYRAVKLAPFDGMDQRRVRHADQRALLQVGLDCVAAVRAALAADVAVYVDCHSKFDVPTALVVSRELAAMGVTWFEEPVPMEDRAALARLRPLPPDQELIGGELLSGIDGFWPYLTGRLVDLIMPDVKHCGGIMPCLAICLAADAAGIAAAPHNPSGPVATVASAQVAAALPNLRALEFAWGEVPWRADLISPREQIENGELIVPEGAGLGITLNEDTVEAQTLEDARA